MGLITLVKNLLNLQKKIDVKILPSKGLFYNDDFEVWIKKADIEHILQYEFNYIKDNLGVIIEKVKNLVRQNTIFSYGYEFEDLKSIDIIFLFLEIVKFTKGKPIRLDYINENSGREDIIEFSNKNFNYFKIRDEMMKKYNNEEKVFDISGYKYSLPSIGVENSLTNFLISKIDSPKSNKYNSYFYGFTFFLGDKKYLSFDEIENLIQIFNYDISDKEMSKVNEIVNEFEPIQIYSLIKDGDVIEISSKIDLENIWK